jgi:hypothetical protein
VEWESYNSLLSSEEVFYDLTKRQANLRVEKIIEFCLFSTFIIYINHPESYISKSPGY